jgi:hypothetical protein
MEKKFDFPTEVVELPSKGLLYPEDSPLSSGTIEMKYMTAKEEDILTNINYLQQGIVIDKLLQALIVSDVKYDDLLIGDKNALLIAARVLGYGKDYDITYGGEKVTVDLSKLENKKLDKKLFKKGVNEFEFTLPTSGVVLKFKFLSHKDEKEINQEIKGLQKIDKDSNPENSTRLKFMITEVDGDSKKGTIRKFVDNFFLARDSRAFRAYVSSIQPDVDLTFYPEGGPEGGVEIPIGISFLWPDAGI